MGTKYIFDYRKSDDSPTLYFMKSLPFEYGGNDNFSDNKISTNDSRVSITKDTDNKRVTIELKSNVSYSCLYYGLYLNEIFL